MCLCGTAARHRLILSNPHGLIDYAGKRRNVQPIESRKSLGAFRVLKMSGSVLHFAFTNA